MQYFLYKKNIKLTPAQLTCEILKLSRQSEDVNDSLVVLGFSSVKFNEIVKNYTCKTRVSSAGITTCALIESDRHITF